MHAVSDDVLHDGRGRSRRFGRCREIAQALDEESYEKLFVKRDIKPGDVKVKLKILEWLQDTF